MMEFLKWLHPFSISVKSVVVYTLLVNVSVPLLTKVILVINSSRKLKMTYVNVCCLEIAYILCFMTTLEFKSLSYSPFTCKIRKK